MEGGAPKGFGLGWRLGEGGGGVVVWGRRHVESFKHNAFNINPLRDHKETPAPGLCYQCLFARLQISRCHIMFIATR